MLKRAVILYVALFLVGGCTVFKKQQSEILHVSHEANDVINLKDVVNQNITASGFFISKAEVELTSKGVSEKFIANVKYLTTGEYLISLRSRTGVEGARIFISNDTVLINDRINRKLYYGSDDEMSGKFGFNSSLIPVILGDYIATDLTRGIKENCIDGKVINYQLINGTGIEFTLNCNELKVISVRTENFNTIRLRFSEYFNLNEKRVAGKVEFEDIARNIKLLIRIRKVESPWEGEIFFIPGSGYERIPLI